MAELRYVIGDGALDIELPVRHQQHRGGGQPDHFGEAGEIVDGSFLHRPLVRIAVVTNRGAVRHRPASTD